MYYYIHPRSINLHFPDTLLIRYQEPHILSLLFGALNGSGYFLKLLVQIVKFDAKESDIVFVFSYQIVIFKIIYFAAFRYLQ